MTRRLRPRTRHSRVTRRPNGVDPHADELSQAGSSMVDDDCGERAGRARGLELWDRGIGYSHPVRPRAEGDAVDRQHGACYDGRTGCVLMSLRDEHSGGQ